MNSIKKFFEQKKAELKFKRLGTGHRLDESSSTVRQAQGPKCTSPRQKMSADSAKAAQAAIERHETGRHRQRNIVSTEVNSVNMKRQLEHERARIQALNAAAARTETKAGQKMIEKDVVENYTVSGVYFECPMIGIETPHPYLELRQKIDEYLKELMQSEPLLASSAMIQTANTDKEKISVCVKTLGTYLQNIIDHPGEVKYTKIKSTNKNFQDRVGSVKGGIEFLKAAGFHEEVSETADGPTSFLVIGADEAANTAHVQEILDTLNAAEPVQPVLNRAIQCFSAERRRQSEEASVNLPPDFYTMSVDELRREQRQREENAEKLGMLRTKAMRERDAERELRRYRYVLVRVTFPDNHVVQAIFKATETLADLYDVTRSFLSDELADFAVFSLVDPVARHPLPDTDAKTLVVAGLAPAAVIVFQWESDFLRQVAQQNPTLDLTHCIKPDIVSLAHSF